MKLVKHLKTWEKTFFSGNFLKHRRYQTNRKFSIYRVIFERFEHQRSKTFVEVFLCLLAHSKCKLHFSQLFLIKMGKLSHFQLRLPWYFGILCKASKPVSSTTANFSKIKSTRSAHGANTKVTLTLLHVIKGSMSSTSSIPTAKPP